MAKVTDYNIILDEVANQLHQLDWSITDYVGEETAKIVVANIYYTNDIIKGYGQDLRAHLSVISSQRVISVIHDGQMGMYKDDQNLCLYENLSDDIYEILLVMQTAFDRMTD